MAYGVSNSIYPSSYETIMDDVSSKVISNEDLAKIAAANAAEKPVSRNPMPTGSLAIPTNYGGGKISEQDLAAIAAANAAEPSQEIDLQSIGTLAIPKPILSNGFSSEGGYTTANGVKLNEIPDFLRNADVAAAYAGNPQLNQNYNYNYQNRFADSTAWDQISGGLMNAPASGSNALRANQAARSGMGQMQGQDFARLGNQLGETMRNEFGNADTINRTNKFNVGQSNQANRQTTTNRIHALDAQRKAELDNWATINADIAGRNVAGVYDRAESTRADSDGLFGGWF